MESTFEKTMAHQYELIQKDIEEIEILIQKTTEELERLKASRKEKKVQQKALQTLLISSFGKDKGKETTKDVEIQDNIQAVQEEQGTPAKHYAVANRPKRGIYTPCEEVEMDQNTGRVKKLKPSLLKETPSDTNLSKAIVVGGKAVRHRSSKPGRRLLMTVPHKTSTSSFAETLKQSPVATPRAIIPIPTPRAKEKEEKMNSVIKKLFFSGPKQEKYEAEPLEEAKSWFKEIQKLAQSEVEDESSTMLPCLATFGPNSFNLLAFTKGADPKIVRKAWEQGFVKIIMLSENLEEISEFPSEVFSAIKKHKHYNRDYPVTLFCNSTFADFNEDGTQCIYKPYHYIWLAKFDDPKLVKWEWNCEEEELDFRQWFNQIRGLQVKEILERIQMQSTGAVLYKSEFILICRPKKGEMPLPEWQEGQKMEFISTLFDNRVRVGEIAAQQICIAIKNSYPQHVCIHCSKTPALEEVERTAS